MSVHCPSCGSHHVITRNVGRKIGGATGAAAGTASGAAGALSGAKAGALVGAVGGPLGATIGSLAGACMSQYFFGAEKGRCGRTKPAVMKNGVPLLAKRCLAALSRLTVSPATRPSA